MSKKHRTDYKKPAFSVDKYFPDDEEWYRPFSGLKSVPKKEPTEKPERTQSRQISKKVYDMYTPKASNVVQKNEDLPLSFLKECQPQESLDLHGKRPERDDISKLVNDFLSEAVEKGKRKVEIVVGKGNHSQGEPVLPSLVEVVLKNSPVVRDYENAPSNMGGSGSFWIILGKRGAKPVNVYSTESQSGVDIRGLEKVGLTNAQKPKPIDYDSYTPKAEDILEKF